MSDSASILLDLSVAFLGTGMHGPTDMALTWQLLRDYEETKRLEDEEFEYAIASGLDGVDGSGQVGSG